MTPTRGHITAFIALLETGAPPGTPVYDGDVPKAAVEPYFAVYSATPIRSATTLAAVSDWQESSIQVTSVSATAQQAQALAERAADTVCDMRPTIPGRACGPVRHQGSNPVQRDDQEAGHAPVFYAVDTYALSSVPAPATR